MSIDPFSDFDPLRVVNPQDVNLIAIKTGSRVVPVGKLLANLCRSNECKFVLDGVPTDSSIIMSPSMFLPVVAWISQQSGDRLLGVDLGCSLRKDEASMFGVRCIVPHLTGHIVDVIRSLFFVHYATELFGIRPNALIEVKPLYEGVKTQFDLLINSQKTSDLGDISWPQQSQEI